MKEWYCVINDSQQGPFNEEQLIDLIKKNELISNTLVWNEDFDEKWIKASETELSVMIQKYGINISDVQTSSQSGEGSSIYIISFFVIAICLFIGINFVRGLGFFVSIIVSIILICALKRLYFPKFKIRIRKMVLASLSAILLLMIGQLMYNGGLKPVLNDVLLSTSVSYKIESKAPEVVNEIIEENFPQIKTRCNKVVIAEKVSDKFYKCKAFMDDDKNVIDIEVVNDGQSMSVNIPMAGMQFLRIR